MNIEYHIKHRHIVALHQDLKADPNFLKEHPELRQAALNAFIGSHGVVSNHGYDLSLNRVNPADQIKMCVSDARKLCDLVKRGIFTYDEVKDLFPRGKSDVVLAVVAKFPNLASSQEISWLAAELASQSFFSDMVQKEIRAVPGLEKLINEFKTVHEVHNS